METTPTLSKKQLIRSVLIAILIGAIVLVTAVLPAEYNIDPLGAGKLFGFSKLYVEDEGETIQMKTGEQGVAKFDKLKLEKLGSPPSVPRPVEADNPPPEKQYSERSDTIIVTVLPGKGIEYKFKALKYGSVKYDWATDKNQIVYIDFHGELIQEKPAQFYESHTHAYSNNMAGTFTAPFEGKHGWYFRNQNKDTVNVTLHLKGQYELFDK